MLLGRCNYSQCCMNTCKVDVFILAVQYFVCSWTRKQPADLVYDRLLDKVKSYETSMKDYHHNKESKKDSTAFPATVSTSTVSVCSIESYRRSSSSRAFPHPYYLLALPYIQHTMWQMLAVSTTGSTCAT